MFLAIGVGVAACGAASARNTSIPECGAWPTPFVQHKPFIFTDPRSGLTLTVESDNRHVTATAPNGKVRWRRNLFADPKMKAAYVPPPDIEGQPRLSMKTWNQRVQWQIDHESIDRIGPVPECEIKRIDHHLSPMYRGHYIRAGSGMHIFYLLDATTGDIVVEMVN